MNLEEIKSLIDMLEGTEITELNIEDDEYNIKIKKGVPVNETRVSNPTSPAPASPEVKTTDQSEVNTQVEEDTQEAEAKEIPDNREEITAPMVGTFYRSPAPDADPFVEIGDNIQEGETLCIIEAMKLMNEIETDISGEIVEILVEDSEPVEYGQPLFIIEKE